VVAEQFNGQFGNYWNVVSAAIKFGEPVHVLVPGDAPNEFAEAVSQTAGVDKVWKASHPDLENPMGYHLAGVAEGLLAEHGYNRVIAAATAIGKDFIPWLGGKMDLQPITDVIEIHDSDTFSRPVYAGNAISKVKSSDAVKLITIWPTNFDKAGDGGSAEIEDVDVSAWMSTIGGKFVENLVEDSDLPDLATAEIVVAGGRALKRKENFDKILYPFAAKLGKAAVGASWAAVDAGFCSNDLQIGQTGKVVAPNLYIAVGISGAIQHVAGMKDSKVIVCINKDAECPMFEIADYGLVGDLYSIIEEMNSKL
jgi:electron transfer flavoprotein alpha subunit